MFLQLIEPFIHPAQPHRSVHDIFGSKSCFICHLKSTGSMTLTEGDTKGKRDRVAKACRQCRIKKIKCDGKPVCGQCFSTSKECEYPSDSEKRPRMKVKVEKTDSIQGLNSRMAKLEAILLRMVDKTGGNEVKQALQREPASWPETSDEQEDIEDKATYDVSSTPYLLGKEEVDTNSVIRPLQTSTGFSLEQFYGSHSMFQIFSEKSIEYMKEKMGETKPDDNPFLPIENLPIVNHLQMKKFTSLLTEPQVMSQEDIARMRRGTLPEDFKFVFELLELVDNIFLVGFLCCVDEVRALFNVYYSNINILPTTRKRPLKYSEHLLMNIILALCVGVAVDKGMVELELKTPSADTLPDSSLSKMSIKGMITLQDELCKNAFFYYHRVALFSEGVITVQAILLLVVYLETSWVTSNVNYSIASTVVRFAQELGLHRFESFANLPPLERERRRRLWWFCEVFDMDICYRTGKPPLLNEKDVTTLTPRDTESLFTRAYQESTKVCVDTAMRCKMPMSADVMASLAEEKIIHLCYGYLHLELTKIRARSYTTLFSASANFDSLGAVYEALKPLNEEMFRLAQLIEKRCRPHFYYEANFKTFLASKEYFNETNVDCFDENVLSIQLAYFQHLMAINRLPFVINNPTNLHDNPYAVVSRNLALDSARSILHTVLLIDRKKTPFSFICWIIFFPFAAFLCLLGNCINHPGDPECISDTRLLFDVALNFFATNKRLYKSSKTSASVYHQRETMCDVSVRVLLRILIRILGDKTDLDALLDMPRVRELLENTEKEYPILFKRSPGLQKVNYGFFEYNGSTSVRSSPQNSSSENGSQGNQSSTPSGTVPSLENILQPTGPFVDSYNGSNIMLDYLSLDDSSVTSMLFSQVGALPNYFFDNSL